jgi:hypothetical protein
MAAGPIRTITTSDTLLTIIEGSAPYEVAFGFDKGSVTLVPTGGQEDQ